MIKTIKFILVGDVSVGKTSLLKSFETSTFNPDHEPTIGLAYSQKNITVNGEEIQLQIWDTAGQEEYKAITKSYYRNSACVILVFDVTNLRSLKNMDTWLKDIHNNTHDEVVLTLVGNKADCTYEERQVSHDMAERYASLTKMQYIEASAKTHSKVKDVFELSFFRVLDKLKQGQIEMNESGNMGVFEQRIYRDSMASGEDSRISYNQNREKGERTTTRFEKRNGEVLLDEKKSVICGAKGSSGGCC